MLFKKEEEWEEKVNEEEKYGVGRRKFHCLPTK